MMKLNIGSCYLAKKNSWICEFHILDAGEFPRHKIKNLYKTVIDLVYNVSSLVEDKDFTKVFQDVTINFMPKIECDYVRDKKYKYKYFQLLDNYVLSFRITIPEKYYYFNSEIKIPYNEETRKFDTNNLIYKIVDKDTAIKYMIDIKNEFIKSGMFTINENKLEKAEV